MIDHDSLILSDSLSINGKEVNSDHDNGLVGLVEITKYDKNGKAMCVERGCNKIIRPGSISVLEHLFHLKAASDRNEFPTSFPSRIFSGRQVTISNGWSTSTAVKDEVIIGCCLGNGGANSSAVYPVIYNANGLVDSSALYSFVPFRCSTSQCQGYGISGITDDGQGNTYYLYYSKPVTKTGGVDNISITSNNQRALATMEFEITAQECIEYLNMLPDDGSQVKGINQLGLVAGIYNSQLGYVNARLITAYNFSTIVPDGVSSFKITYSLYAK